MGGGWELQFFSSLSLRWEAIDLPLDLATNGMERKKGICVAYPNLLGTRLNMLLL